MKLIENEQTSTERMLARQKAHNDRSKSIAKIFGANLSLYICMMIPALLVGFIWTDTGLPHIGWGLLCDGAVTVFLFFLAEYSMIQVGISGGRLDDEYVRYHDEYIALTSKVLKLGTALMYPFCEWQIEAEHIRAVKDTLRAVGVAYDDWEKRYRHMSEDELVSELGARKTAAVISACRLEPIELTPDMILTDGPIRKGRGGVSESGFEYIERKKRSWRHVLIGSLSALFTVMIALTLTSDISLARVLYTFAKLCTLFFRMSSGYASGARAFNTVEVTHLQSKLALEYAYIEYIEKELYLNFGDRYGKIDELIGKRALSDASSVDALENREQ